MSTFAFIFFFQAEDGIRDADVTGVQTCALPISYSRTLAPLGEVTGPPPQSQIRRFRQLSRAYGAHGVSWWEWAEATRGSWHALSQPVGSPSNFRPRGSMAALGRGAQGDLVVWAQEHLVG